MARDNSAVRESERKDGDQEEATGLLQQSRDVSPDEGLAADAVAVTNGRPLVSLRMSPRRQSSLVRPRADGTPRTPRTPHRVRFEVAEPETSREPNGSAEPHDWTHEVDYLAEDAEDILGNRDTQRAPLLTDIEAPSVTVASTDTAVNPEELLESARPKSGLRSAFMNMANSIIGAGIIGQPYAFRQAGLFTGIVLLIVLTITVDWTIRLIVTNSKLSGANSFQATMQHCFGKSGLIAISIAQWAFAFGGMVAFCIIIGDTIPHVLVALIPSLPGMPVLWLFSDRRAIIVLFVLGISFPLSLYRDIAMVSFVIGKPWDR